MKPEDVICEMKGSGIESLAHIMINRRHEYYVSISDIEQAPADADIKVLSMEVKHLSTEDVVGKAPKPGKRRLYNKS